MENTQLLITTAVGILAGVIGGLAGVGGSMVAIPGLALAFGYKDASHAEQHVYMAAAMCVNVVVSVQATLRHHRAGAMRRDLIVSIVPWMLASMIAGVFLSNLISGLWLKYILCAFVGGYCLITLRRVAFPPSTPESDLDRPLVPRRTSALIGILAGLVGGLLGLGGGVVMVPLLQLAARVPLRQAVAASSAVMCITAFVGSIFKLLTLSGPPIHRSPTEALWYALCLAPGAMLGAAVGSWLTHKLPLRLVRALILVILAAAVTRLAMG